MEKRPTAILNPSMFYLGLKHIKNPSYLFNILNYKMNPVPRSGGVMWSHTAKGLDSSLPSWNVRITQELRRGALGK